MPTTLARQQAQTRPASTAVQPQGGLCSDSALDARVAAEVDGLRLIRLPRSAAPILWHADAQNGDATASWNGYVRELAASGIFADDDRDTTAIEALESLAPRAETLRQDRTYVGIVAAAPRKLTPTADWWLDHFIQRVQSQGAVPVLLPPVADLVGEQGAVQRHARLTAIGARLDGFVGPGGADADPAIFGAENTHSRGFNGVRDRYEVDLAGAAMAQELFAVGVCRSHQIWNIAHGATIVQDIEAAGLSSGGRNQRFFLPKEEALHGMAVRTDGTGTWENRVEIDAGTESALAIGHERVLTNTFHHQAVAERRLGPGRAHQVLQPTAWVKDTVDGNETRTIAMSERAPNVITTQFHPEIFDAEGQARPFQANLWRHAAQRARIYRLVKQQRQQTGKPITPADVASEMQRAASNGEVTWSTDDHRWARECLGPHLGRAAIGVKNLTAMFNATGLRLTGRARPQPQ